MKLLKIMIPISFINVIALIVVSLKLPATVPIHINAANFIDGYGPNWALPILGLLPILLTIGMLFYWRHMNKKDVIPKNQKVESILFNILITFFLVLTWLPVLIAFANVGPDAKIDLPLSLIIGIPLGILMIVFGNFMGIIKYNRFLGIRTPWTLGNQNVWKRTHRLGGYTAVIGGIIIIIGCLVSFLLDNNFIIMIVSFISGLIFVAVIPFLYSFVIYRKILKHS